MWVRLRWQLEVERGLKGGTVARMINDGATDEDHLQCGLGFGFRMLVKLLSRKD